MTLTANNTFLDALIEERYHLTTSTILSLGSVRSAALKQLYNHYLIRTSYVLTKSSHMLNTLNSIVLPGEYVGMGKKFCIHF